jgi:hypothetical protein
MYHSQTPLTVQSFRSKRYNSAVAVCCNPYCILCMMHLVGDYVRISVAKILLILFIQYATQAKCASSDLHHVQCDFFVLCLPNKLYFSYKR